MKKAWLGLVLALAQASLLHAGREDTPDWLETARRAPVPAPASKAPIVLLLEERMLVVSKTETRARVREALKILTSEGMRSAPLQAHQRLGQNFRLVGAWLIKPDGTSTRFESKEIGQFDADGTYEFSMSKVNQFRPEATRVGDTLAWEYEFKSKSEAYTEYWTFGWTGPTLVSRFGIKLPEGWKERHSIRHHQEVRPALDDGGFTVWEMRELPALKTEPMSPALSDLLPMLVLTYGPAAGGDERRTFASWQSVGKWYAGLVAGQAVADDEVRRTAAQLVTGRTDPLERIRSVTGFVQGVRYMNVAMGRSTAEPHPAPMILKNRFGDCEDKSVLVITLLHEAGVDAFPVQARTSRLGSLDAEFPAPNIFNHVVVAIKAPEGVQLPSTLNAGPLGRLIIFDPTDTTTGLGDLDQSLQGTQAVISHAQHGGLFTLPTLAPETSTREVEANLSFASTGGIRLSARVTYTGQYAASKRSHYAEVRGEKRREEVASRLTAQFGKTEVTSFAVEGADSPEGPVTLELDISMPLPGRDLGSIRTMAGHFLMPTSADILNESDRKSVLKIRAGYREIERMSIEVPEGWRVSHSVPSVEASSPAGRYTLSSAVDGNRLVLDRELIVSPATVAPAEYAPVKKFFDEVARGDAAMVAFEKQPK